jgi:uncharacterized protein (DUF1810 family)
MAADPRHDDQDPFGLERFVEAQRDAIDAVRRELRVGRKATHWMWFVFPQVEGLGSSEMARRYAIGSLEEALDYLRHPVLGPRLHECAELLLASKEASIERIVGTPDDLKLRSSMTLFALVSESSPVFERVLERFFDGEADPATQAVMKRWAAGRQ